MNAQQILALYDRELRMQPSAPHAGFRRERVGSIVRDTGPTPEPHDNCVIYSRLDPASADAAIQEQVDYYTRIGHGFEWKVHGHDLPHDMTSRLTGHGFEAEEEEALVVLDLEEVLLDATPPARVEIRRLAGPDTLDDVIAVQDRVWGGDHAWLRDALADELWGDPESLSLYGAYEGVQPICSAWIRFPPETQFASLWGGSTLPEHRGRGVYKAMVAVRAQEARRRSRRFLTVDAGPMSRPILERMGFRFLTSMTACIWRTGSSDG